MPTSRNQLCMGAALNHPAFVHNYDMIGRDNGRQAVGDDQSGAVCGEFF